MDTRKVEEEEEEESVSSHAQKSLQIREREGESVW